MRVSMTNKTNKKYRIRAFLIFIGLLFFVIVPFVVPQKKVSAGTKIGTAIDNGDANVYLQEATYYKENRLLEISFLSEGKDISSRPFNVEVAAMNTKNKKYGLKQEKINDNYVVVFVSDVPDDFSEVKVQLTDKNKSSEMFEATLDPIFVTPRNVNLNTEFTAKSTKDYQKKYLDGLITIQQNHLKAIDDEIDELNKQIADLEKSSSDVTENVELMTGTEKQKAMDKIKQNTSQIAQIKKQIETKEEEKTEYKEKIDRVENAQ